MVWHDSATAHDGVLRIEPVSSYWNGAATYYRGIIRALHARGWRITFLEPDALKPRRQEALSTRSLRARRDSRT